MFGAAVRVVARFARLQSSTRAPLNPHPHASRSPMSLYTSRLSRQNRGWRGARVGISWVLLRAHLRRGTAPQLLLVSGQRPAVARHPRASRRIEWTIGSRMRVRAWISRESSTANTRSSDELWESPNTRLPSLNESSNSTCWLRQFLPKSRRWHYRHSDFGVC